MDEKKLLENPIFFDPNRVWRCYLGGKLLDEFTGKVDGPDANFPEDWLASVTRADNGDCQQSPDEGLSKIRGTDLLFADLLRAFPGEALGSDDVSGGIGVLCKFLDSAIRLPIQCHPDREFARRHFHSEHGKTESWLILASREIGGEKPYLLLGFKPGVTEAQFRKAVLAQDVPAMCACLHRFEAKPGEVYIIPGRLPHAIGPGLMLLEVQEPTDFVIQSERHIGKITLSERQMWGGLDPDIALACFDCHGRTPEALLSGLKLTVQPKKQWPNARLESVIGSQQTDCFRVDKLTVNGEFDLEYGAHWHLAIVTAGSGQVIAAGEQSLRRGDSFFVSNRIRKLKYRLENDTSLELYLITKRA